MNLSELLKEFFMLRILLFLSQKVNNTITSWNKYWLVKRIEITYLRIVNNDSLI